MSAPSANRLARIAGLLYLAIFVSAPFAFIVGRESLVVAGDATATAANIASSETAVRLGLVIEAVVFLVEIVLAAVLYVLFRGVSRPVSLAAAFARLAEAVTQGVGLVTGIVVLTALGGGGYLAAVGQQQLDALLLLVLEVNGAIILVWGLFFGLHLLLLGWLVARSDLMPRVVGALLVVASAGYLAEGIGNIVSPGAADALSILVIALAVPGELLFTFWLVVRGIDQRAWHRRTAMPQPAG